MDLECNNGGTFQYGCSNMGISQGCGDIYTAGLDCQWIDITNVPDGRYTLVVRVNWDQSPDALGHYEIGYQNNWAQVCLNISRTPSLNFSVATSCPAFVDCAGDTFGTAVPDCNGVCNGFTQMGDLNGDTLRTQIDVNQYVTGILGTTLSPTNCNDINQDGNIDVFDAALVNNCAIYGSNHPLPGGGFSNECDFPGGIRNPNDSVLFRISNHDLVNQTVQIDFNNPTNRVKAYQFNMSGITISSVDNLIPTSQFPVSPSFNPSGTVLALSPVDSAINRNFFFTPLVRIHYSAITAGAICLDEIISVVNNDYEETAFGIDNACFVIVGREQELAATSVKTYPNPFSESTTLQFMPTGNDFIVEISDLTGKILRRYENTSSGKLQIEKGNLSSGTYLLSLKGDYSWSGKLVVK